MKGIIDLLKVFQTIPLAGKLFLLISFELGTPDFIDLVVQHIQTLGPLLLICLLLSDRRLELRIVVVKLLVLSEQRLNLLASILIQHSQVFFRLQEQLVFVLPLNINQIGTNLPQHCRINQLAVDPDRIATIPVDFTHNNQGSILILNSE